MSCSDISELAIAISSIADAMRDAPSGGACCDLKGSAGGKTEDDPADEQSTIDPSEESNPPEGWDDWGEYNSFKCAMAHRIASDLTNDVALYATLQFLGATVLSVATALGPILVTPAGWITLAAIAGILIAIAQIGAAILDDAHDTCVAIQPDLACALYMSSGTVDAQHKWRILISEYVDANYSGDPLTATYIKLLLNAHATTNNLNRLVDRDDINPPSPADCSSCEEPTIGYWWLRVGSVASVTATDLNSQSVNANQYGCWSTSKPHRVLAYFDGPGILPADPECQDHPGADVGVVLEAVNITSGPANIRLRVRRTSGTLALDTTTPWSGSIDGVRSVSLDTGQGAFDATMQFASGWQGQGQAT